MLLFDNPNKDFKYSQVFTYFDLVHGLDNNTTGDKIYSFEINQNSPEYTQDRNKINPAIFDKTTPISTHTFDIKILDNLINLKNINSNKSKTFSQKMNWTSPEENELNLPIFSFNLKEINGSRMPVLLDKLYDLSSQYTFIVYKINDHTQYVIETNQLSKIKKKYFITTDIKSIKKYIC